ncbi:hypothetical protein PHLH3_09030 [Pseudomonas sp. St386]|nr:hypothetical protein PHLH3_09030 [Pseudomonas sp. St386]
MYRPLRGQARSHTGSSVGKKFMFGTVPSVGASLLAIAVGQLARMLDVPPPSRASLAPTLDLQWTRNLCSAQFPLWEQSLLAIAVGQLAWILDVPASSRASPLPHWIFSGQEIYVWHSSLCGSELARDSGGSACPDVGCTAAIAGKPCSHTGSSVDKKLVFGTVSSVGAKLARDSGGSACLDVGCAGLFAGKPCSHTGSSVDKKLVFGTVSSVGASLLAIAVGQLARMLDVPPPSRASLAPTLDLQWTRNLCSAQFPLWEQSLLAIAVGQLAWMLDVPASSRASLAPTLDLQWTRNLCLAQFPLWEQSLLAIAVGQLAWMLDVPASSRASPLPHWIFSGQEIYVWHSSLCGSKACSR